MIMLNTPGHTPGHHSLLVKLPQMGSVVISGDAVHFRENYDNNGVPRFNSDRSQTLASIERLKGIVATFKATLIIQHDARDIDKLPAFPKRLNNRGMTAVRCGRAVQHPRNYA